MSESNLFDFHELRQDFSPPIQEMKTVSGHNVRETVLCFGELGLENIHANDVK